MMLNSKSRRIAQSYNLKLGGSRIMRWPLLPLAAVLVLALLAVFVAPAPVTEAQTPPAHYDTDGDGLIEIDNLTQLNAIRWDLDGDGVPPWRKEDDYAAAFPVADGGSVCPAGTTCTGFELTTNLDFDENGDGEITDADAAYWNDGAGWEPIGKLILRDTSVAFSGVLEGNGHVISNMYFHRLIRNTGLFGYIAGGGEVRNLGLDDMAVTGDWAVGGLAGATDHATIQSSYASGSVNGLVRVGGLVGSTSSNSRIVTSYFVGKVHSETEAAGGLVGKNAGDIKASYAEGSVRAIRSNVGGLVGMNDESGNIEASYANAAVRSTVYSHVSRRGHTYLEKPGLGGVIGENAGTVISSYADAAHSRYTPAIGKGNTEGAEVKATAELQMPGDYTGIYANWSLDLDGDSNNDNPWDFGGASQYPALQVDFNGDDTATWQEFGSQRTARNGAHDTDGDGLIEVTSLAQLNAIRWDLDGDGEADWDADSADYAAAFPNDLSGTVCPIGAACLGYELTTDLDFDANNDGEITDADPYWNRGAGWRPLGKSPGYSVLDEPSPAFTAALNGNGHTIRNLSIDRPETKDVGLIGFVGILGRVESLGLIDADVQGLQNVGRMVGENEGTIINSYSTGSVQAWAIAGGLVGYNTGTIERSHAFGSVTVKENWGGGLAGYNNGTIVACHAIGKVHGRSYTGGLVGLDWGTVAYSYSGGTVSGRYDTGGLLGETFGTVYGSYSTAQVHGVKHAGGLVGELENVEIRITKSDGSTVTVRQGARVIASYATGAVFGTYEVGGLVGYTEKNNVAQNRQVRRSAIIASYSTGPVRNLGNVDIGGLVGLNHSDIEFSYFDKTTSGREDAIGLNFIEAAQAEAKTTTELQAPTSYAGIYEDWNVDLDNADGDDNLYTGVDDPWDFGTEEQYPALKADLDGDGTATWREFGYQLRERPALAATSAGTEIGLSWNQVDMSHWTDVPSTTYALYRDGEKMTGYDGGTRSYTDTGLTLGQTYSYQVAALLDGVEHRRSNIASVTPISEPLSFGDVRHYDYTWRQNMHNGRLDLPRATGGVAPLTYTVSPDLPAGLVFDAGYLTINGIPTESQARVHYAYTVTDANGDTASLSFSILVLPPPITVSAGQPVTVREGDAVTYQVSVDSQPAENVVVTVFSDNPDVAIQPASLTFTTDNWQTAQTVTVSAAHDGDRADEQAVIRHQVSGLTVASVTVNVTDDESDREILRDFYNATGGANWTDNDGWLSNQALDQWHGVSTNGQGQVTQLSLRDNGLSGSLPAKLGQMDSLQVLSLDRNSLSGSLPVELGDLSNLTRLALNRNSLTGSIPSELGNLSNLSIIGLARNSLSGTLPTSLGNLTGLTRLSLHDNTALSGELPSGFTALVDLQRLAIANTGLCAPDDEAFSAWLDGVSDKPGGVATCQ